MMPTARYHHTPAALAAHIERRLAIEIVRMADEIDAGQARGEVATKGQRANVRDADISELDEFGVSRQRLSEWRETRHAGLDATRGA